jgi:hypothetical protein
MKGNSVAEPNLHYLYSIESRDKTLSSIVRLINDKVTLLVTN